mmetsp:Transcript_18820/g.54577  ORF Transcript_18820/g.54577 Transcript_18820/m.54577 type:complete len:221 (-) Transcript_18820:709-1371(-)
MPGALLRPCHWRCAGTQKLLQPPVSRIPRPCAWLLGLLPRTLIFGSCARRKSRVYSRQSGCSPTVILFCGSCASAALHWLWPCRISVQTGSWHSRPCGKTAAHFNASRQHCSRTVTSCLKPCEQTVWPWRPQRRHSAWTVRWCSQQLGSPRLWHSRHQSFKLTAASCWRPCDVSPCSSSMRRRGCKPTRSWSWRLCGAMVKRWHSPERSSGPTALSASRR